MAKGPDMATKKRSTTSSTPRHVGGSGTEYNSGVKLTAKMTPAMKKRLAKKSKGK